MARKSEACSSGIQPFCQAKPSITGLVKMLSPSSWLAMPSASTQPRAVGSCNVSAICAMQASPGLAQLAFLTNAAVGALWLLMTTWLRPARRRMDVSLPAVTMGSQPITRSAQAIPTRVVRMASCVLPISTWLQVAPPFCARPPASWVTMPLPSMCAATPSNWPMVMTPVPPTPATTRPQTPSCAVARSAIVGSGMSSIWLELASAGAFFLRRLPPSTVTKLGQNPLTHETSLLQVLWLIWRLRPKSVSSGSTLMQLLCTPQSPQPSHTSSLITTRTAGSTSVPRLRRRRFSVAQVWS